MCAAKSRSQPETVDEYIARHPSHVRAILRKVRSVVRAAAPGAREVVSYGMPALKQHGMLVYFGAFKHHIGLYPPVRGDERLVAATARYAGPKGNLRFPLDKPIPYALIGRITKLRVTQERSRVAAGRTRRRA
jgi:uncharacterized protein YdhG (YjbR/CyaY superfamily)